MVLAYAASSQFSLKPGPWRVAIRRAKYVDSSSTCVENPCRWYIILPLATWLGDVYFIDHRRANPRLVSEGALGPPIVSPVRWACK